LELPLAFATVKNVKPYIYAGYQHFQLHDSRGLGVYAMRNKGSYTADLLLGNSDLGRVLRNNLELF
jgi:hypothetical protein